MTPSLRRPMRRPNMRRAVILFPSGLTLGNLFFGVFAIIAASRLEFTAAGVYVMLGGICDALDGRVARATNAGSEFGEELDSLVDAITFGLAPALIMYFAVLNRDGWDWVWVFIFAACAVLRLARFNIEQAGTAKTYFQGLPSPAAGITLASYYWFSQSSLYNYGAIADLKWHVLLRYLMVVLSGLMISPIPFPSFPRTGFRSLRAIGASLLVLGAIALLLSRRLEYFFPIALLYIAWGLARWIFSGLFERRQPTLPYDLSEGEDDEDDEEYEVSDSVVHASRQGHRDEPARNRTTRPERGHADMPSSRGDRPERTPRKPDRAERADRPDSEERPGGEASADADRGARRDNKKERPKRPERGERPVRPERPVRTERPGRAVRPELEAPVAVVGISEAQFAPPQEIPVSHIIQAIPISDDDEASAPDDEEEMEDVAEVTGPPIVDGTPPRKRKRRRRRGERKERGPSDAAATPTSPGDGTAASVMDASATVSPSRDAERSPYAITPVISASTSSDLNRPVIAPAPSSPAPSSAPTPSPSQVISSTPTPTSAEPAE
ncbi:MAG: CDP-diacylglycerol--serine O-phosphatidyltransferase [Gemmatimonadaceae bacterium]|nr:CDP-diacylglycerol--serine O-phosphatidyltransferase [Gemmatimonadaceae bacterium]